MKILVLVWVQLLMLSLFTTSDTNNTSETYTLINSTNLAKPGCRSKCGDVIVPYPFGIGIKSNCSIGHGFDVYYWPYTFSEVNRFTVIGCDDYAWLTSETNSRYVSTDINECHYPEMFPCHGTCINTLGNYTCECGRGYSGDAKIRDGCRRKPYHPL
ncbi:EGF-like calcium-binding, partial [Cynara cardunculus var. scolymus]